MSITIIHFNDVYEVVGREKDPHGGADRFATMVKSYKDLNPLVIFSGDAFSPSTLSSYTRGSHMPPILNSIGVHYATLGNHDFDYGVERLLKLKSLCKFPWFLANIVDENGIPLADAQTSRLIEWNGIKVGLFGVAESEWLDTLPTLPKTTRYVDQVAVAKKICEELREQGAQLIVAITHSRAPNDIILAGGVPEIDIILGGHDHEYYIHNKNHIPILNSGCNFVEATVVTVSMGKNEGLDAEFYEEVKTEGNTMWEIKGPRATFKLDKIEVGSKYERDPELASMIDHYTQVVEEKKKKQLCYSHTALVAANNVVRSQESNVGNFVCDIMKGLYNTDIAFIGGGTIRSNDTYGPGVITQGDMMNIFPFLDSTVVFEILGIHVKGALENGFSKIPALEGRFPQIAGLWVVYDPNAEPGNRVVQVHTDAARTKPLLDDKLYTIASKPFLLSGGDGYVSFKNYNRILVDDLAGIPSFPLIRNFLLIKQVLRVMSKQNVFELAANAFNKNGPKSSKTPIVSPQVEGRILTVEQFQKLNNNNNNSNAVNGEELPN